MPAATRTCGVLTHPAGSLFVSPAGSTRTKRNLLWVTPSMPAILLLVQPASGARSTFTSSCGPRRTRRHAYEGLTLIKIRSANPNPVARFTYDLAGA
jgi:hypothetical protein